MDRDDMHTDGRTAAGRVPWSTAPVLAALAVSITSSVFAQADDAASAGAGADGGASGAAGSGGAGAGATADSAMPSVWELAVEGGYMMIPIGLCSLVALAVIAERLITLRRGAVIPGGFVERLRPLLPKPGASAVPAIEFCREANQPVARVIAAGLRRLGSPVEVVERHVAEAGEREALVLRRRLRVLAVIAAVTPLMGLLGTILGMIDAFRTVSSSADALGRTELLAGGIYEAMITTAAGLIVAIPAMLAYHWLSAKVQRLVMDLDAASVEVIEELGVAPAPVVPRAGGTVVAATAQPASTGFAEPHPIPAAAPDHAAAVSVTAVAAPGQTPAAAPVAAAAPTNGHASPAYAPQVHGQSVSAAAPAYAPGPASGQVAPGHPAVGAPGTPPTGAAHVHGAAGTPGAPPTGAPTGPHGGAAT